MTIFFDGRLCFVLKKVKNIVFWLRIDSILLKYTFSITFLLTPKTGEIQPKNVCHKPNKFSINVKIKAKI